MTARWAVLVTGLGPLAGCASAGTHAAVVPSDVATGAGAWVTVAFRPSQGLTFSPLAATTDGGKAWTTGLLDAPVASVPDALAGRDTSTMLALLSDGAVDQASASGADWTRLAAPGAIASSAGESTGWTTSAPLAGAGQVIGSGTGPGGAVWVLLAGNRAAVISGAGGTWRMLHAPPPGTAALAALPGGVFGALAVSVAKLTVYRLSAASAWSRTQVINVPIQYGSSS